MKEATMTLYQHIQELRAELSGCTEPSELHQIQAELNDAQQRQASLDEAFNAWMADPG